ncbi:MAG: holo-ACP synthase [Eubacterium sp.]|nr:holo-ACP synthase [Eubacterium sp.]
MFEKIVGIGVDSVEIDRVRKACERDHFVKRIFTEAETSQFDSRKIRAASDFAGKEAVSKVFGTGFSGCQPAEIEVLRNEKGAPYVNLYGGAKEIASQLGIKELKISITNTLDTATAFVIGCGGSQEFSEEEVQ